MALDIPLHKLEEYRATARRRAADQAAARAARLDRARPAARAATTLLRERFGASQVWLFGSLAEETTFGMHSDIDLAVSGLTAGAYLDALAAMDGVSEEFEFGLIDLDHCDPDLRDRITRAGVPL